MGNSQSQSIRSFIFGHSLIDHALANPPTPSNETTVPHWVYLLAQEAGHTYEVSGQYGFLPQHANLPPAAQWGYDLVPPAWDSDNESFADADFNNILLTAGNFMQWQGPDELYPGEEVSAISATQIMVDWLILQEEDLRIYIYENWPDMAPYLSSGNFPPLPAELEAYNNYTTGEFHEWWLEYQDSLLLSHPQVQVRMIPVGPILAGLLTDTDLDQIPLEELYEDDAPHGRPTLYFLAGMITYMAFYQEETPADYAVPPIIHALVQENYQQARSYIWSALQAFNLPDGSSRVFFENPMVATRNSTGDSRQPVLFPNPTSGWVFFKDSERIAELELLSTTGTCLQQIKNPSLAGLDLSDYAKGLYLIRIRASGEQQWQYARVIRL